MPHCVNPECRYYEPIVLRALEPDGIERVALWLSGRTSRKRLEDLQKHMLLIQHHARDAQREQLIIEARDLIEEMLK